MRITLPSLALQMPSLEMPFITRRSRGPKMEIDADQAAYVAGAGQQNPNVNQLAYGMPMSAYGSLAAPTYNQALSAPASRQPSSSQPALALKEPTDSRVSKTEEEFAELQQRCVRLEGLLQQMIQVQQCQPQMAPQNKVPCDYLPH